MSENADTNALIIVPSSLTGSLAIQPSKSAGHRMLVCAALADGESQIFNPGDSEDIQATAGALSSLGLARVARRDDCLHVMGNGGRSSVMNNRTADCAESGSTLRFLLPLALDGVETAFTGRGRLLSRPMGPYEALLSQRGIAFSQTAERVAVCGQLPAGDCRLPGDVSSQFVSGLLFALPTREGASRIELTTPLESRGYVDLTLEAMAAFGVGAYWENERLLAIPGYQHYKPARVRVEGDYSHAAFFLALGVLGTNPAGIACEGLRADTKQGDAAIVDILRAMGGRIEKRDGTLTALPSKLRGVCIDAAQIPDLVPVLAAAACAAEGETYIVNAARLRIKESDRLQSMAQELNRLGGAVEEMPDGLVIRGVGSLKGGIADSHNDHRVAMALAVASTICEKEIELTGWESVKKSAPHFWQEFSSLGGIAHERKLG